MQSFRSSNVTPLFCKEYYGLAEPYEDLAIILLDY